ncbi:MAG: TIGR02597 family protein [Verrucomicrobiaceae bacterium]|nr:MAG: TIGR02597 family protein [Verrucomicrobiaceae bacterium]
MKSILSYSLLAAAMAAGVATAQPTTATTKPVGYVSLGNSGSVPANTDVSISIPINRDTEFAGTVTSISGTSITVTGTPNWATNQFTSVPYLVTIGGGAEEGLTAVVNANGSNTLQVVVVTGNLANVTSGTALSVRKAWTISALLPTGVIPNGTQLLAYDGETAGINLAPTQIYTMTPSGWFLTLGGSGASPNAILYPGESFVLRTAATAITNLVVSGEVPVTKHRVALTKLSPSGTGQDVRASYLTPVDEAVGVAGFPAVNGDQILIYDNASSGRNKAPTVILTKTPTGWFGTLGLSGNQDAYVIPGGKGFVYRFSAANAPTTKDWSDVQTYAPSL